jgi:hypothetical protein
MIDVEKLIQEAEKAFDNLEYEKAVALYKEVILASQGKMIGLLDIVSTLYSLIFHNFVNKVLAMQPDSFHANLQKITLTDDVRAAKKMCDLALERFNERTDQMMRIRTIRFRLSIQSSSAANLLDDFIFIWSNLNNGEKTRRGLMRDFLSISDPQLSHVFAEASKRSEFGSEMSVLFLEKAAFLETLGRLEKTK